MGPATIRTLFQNGYFGKMELCFENNAAKSPKYNARIELNIIEIVPTATCFLRFWHFWKIYEMFSKDFTTDYKIIGENRKSPISIDKSIDVRDI